MLTYYYDLGSTLVRAMLRGEGGLVSRVRRRVHLSEVDLNWHMNQACYAQAAEYGRVDWFVRSGFWSALRARRVHPVVADQRLTYRRELKPLQAYEVDTRAIAVDGRLLVLEGHLIVGSQVHARNETRLIFIGPDGVLAPEAVPPIVEPFLTDPLEVRDWQVA